MSKHNRFTVAALAASIALSMASTAAMAAAPTAAQLPGAGAVVLGAATGGTITSGETITFTANTVINWGVASGATINATSQPGGFNIGSVASLGFTDSASAGSSVLNIDVSGNASQIFGALAMNVGGGNLYVANSNGIVVGATAVISGPLEVGLIANTRSTVAFDGTAGAASIEYAGAGGDVTVATGANIRGTSVLVSGGGVVNVDLSAFTGAGGALALSAGVKNSVSTLLKDNTGAMLTASGALGGAVVVGFASAGNASSSGTLNLVGGNVRVDGVLTNTGTMNLGLGVNIAGAVVNSKTMTQSADISVGSLTNAGAYAGSDFNLTTTNGGLSNNAAMTNMGHVQLTGGDFVNNGQFGGNGGGLDTYGGGSVTNNGQITILGRVNINEGGNFTNTGTMDLGGVFDGVYVLNGSIANSGLLSNVHESLRTASDSTVAGYTAGANYSVTNTGTINVSGNLILSANSDNFRDRNGTNNTSTGSVMNGSIGVLQVGPGGYLQLQAYNDVNLAGTVQAYNGTRYAALSAVNPLSALNILAGDYDSTRLHATGVATVSTDITTSGGASIFGNQVNLLSNLSAVDATGAPVGVIDIVACAQQASGYAVRVASGKTVTANTITVNGDTAGDNPNVILNGTLAAQDIVFGNLVPVSNVFTGPAGSLSLFNISADPSLTFDFTGIVKTVPYNNAPTNFRFNGLPVVTDGSPLSLTLNPVDYQTNGTTNGLSAVNLLVNSDVNLTQGFTTAPVTAGGSAATGVVNTPNTHLVLQSSGNIATVGNFYWPGYVYLGNVSADATTGAALPGTLGTGTITTGGDFNNALPGNIAGASGLHFITQSPMGIGGDIVTNANVLVNFGTDLLTQAYASGTLGNGLFFGGTQGAGSTVNYGPLDASLFNTQAPSATP